MSGAVSAAAGQREEERRRRYRRLSFAYVNMVEPPRPVLEAYGDLIQELDISHNRVRELRWLQCLPGLRTLIADDNQVTCQVTVPPAPCLRTLWLNQNRISNLTTFCLTLATQCPQLTYLSMMKNPAAPSYFNGGSYKQYTDYRQYVISQLRGLQWLDDTQVTGEERREAERVYRRLILG